MFEKEIKNLQQIVRDNTIGNAQSIALKHILESNIPANVKNFFKAEIEWQLYTERKKENRSSKFDYTQEDVSILQEQMDFLLVYHYTFSQKEFFTSLDRCAHFLFNFLCRPQWTLENFLFEEKETLPFNELTLKFRFCGDYGYYWSILEQYLISKNKTELNKDEAVHLLRKIDGELIKSHSAVELGKMTEPFFGFIDYIQQNSGGSPERGIPVKALVYFFEDKRVTSVSHHLLKLRDQGRTAIQYDELIQILKDSFVKKGFSVEEEVAKLTRPQEANNEVLQLHLPDNERLTIIKTIFRNEESHFTSTVEKILSSPSWDDAALALDHFFTMNDVEPFSREAIMLTNALQSYFTNRQSKDETF